MLQECLISTKKAAVFADLYRKIDDLSIEAAGWITSQQMSLYFLPLLHTGLTLKSGPHCPVKADLWSRVYPLDTVTLELQVLLRILGHSC